MEKIRKLKSSSECKRGWGRVRDALVQNVDLIASLISKDESERPKSYRRKKREREREREREKRERERAGGERRGSRRNHGF